jgi:hypothetical protein
MTETDWLACADPGPMLGHLESRSTGRKLRLFAVACWRRLWHLLPDERLRRYVGVLEQEADRLASRKEVAAAFAAAGEALEGDWAFDHASAREGVVSRRLVQRWGRRASLPMAREAVLAAREAAGWYGEWAVAAEGKGQCELLREIFGNPFAVPPARPFPDAVVSLARACYDGDRDVYPILADALDEAGEAHAAAHCREPGHVKGCHVLDWVLGKG